MTTEREPRVGDEVAVHLAGTVIEYDGELRYALGPQGTIHMTPEEVRANAADVEITLGVDHPSRDPAGTVRAGQAEGGHVWIKTSHLYYGNENTGIWWCLVTGEERPRNDVELWPVVENPNIPELIQRFGSQS